MNERKRRIGENEAIFRSVNEEVKHLNATLSTVQATMRIVCECGTRSCTVQFEIPRAEYAKVREDSTLFVIKTDDYWIVRKAPGLPSEIARATDPNR